MAHTIEFWRDLVMARLPPAWQVIERNHAITAQYARWYAGHPGIFKWAGMAAFASYRVGIALTPYLIGVSENSDRMMSVERIDQSNVAPERLPDLDLLRATNTAVYEDIGWAHEAYAQGGLAEVEQAAGLPRYAELVEGFRQIDRGWRLQHGPHPVATGIDLVWTGNQGLLFHEQFRIIQPNLRDLRLDFVVFISALTILEFWIDPLAVFPDRLTCFFLAMLVYGGSMLLRTRSLPDFRIFEHRWFWITERALPLWRRLDEAGDAEVAAGILNLSNAGPVPAARLRDAQRAAAATSSATP